MPATRSTKPKKYVCSWKGCSKAFTRSDHLQRHVLNHTSAGSTCPRCSLHFKRPDLLDRHMLRHRQKDEEAGGDGLGVVESRKRLWRDDNGNIVSKRPTREKSNRLSTTTNSDEDKQIDASLDNDQNMLYIEPLTPPRSLLSAESFDQFSHQLPDLPSDQDFMEPTSGLDMFDFLANSSWGSQASRNMTMSAEGMDDMFKPDTASSFNMPFTTMNNYSWLFDAGDSTPIHDFPQANFAAISETSATSRAQPFRAVGFESNGDNYPYIPGANTDVRALSTSTHSSYGTGMQQSHPTSLCGPDESHISSLRMETTATNLTPSSLSSELNDTTPQSPYTQIDALLPQFVQDGSLHQPAKMASRQRDQTTPPSRSSGPVLSPTQTYRPMPTMDEVSRNHILDILANARPISPDGSEITGDHPLLSLSCMQNYLDLFFSRFNAAYPLLHQATFAPSQTESLLLLSVLLLGATYSDKDVHKMAVCIHDVLRAQIFQHAAFSATPELWMLQTILLVECFGKSRAGQKQHDMAHLFHGLLINLIRRSDCQTVRQPDFGEGSGDLESDWRKAIDVELRKRLAFLCFLWDTQHAVLFSQSLCMSSFELRTTLPCSQAAWEASSAEEWWRYARKERQISYLAVLKAYMNPDSSQFPPLNALSRLLVLHGLMSIQWDMKRRDQTSLGMSIQSGSAALDHPRWQERLAQSYDAWKADFDTFCMNMTLSLSESSPSKRAEFTRFSTATIAIYHAAHITLNVEILDLQIYAGARHIIGRAVTRADYERSRRIVREWAAKPTGSSAGGGSAATPAAKAAWHAAHLLRDGIMNLENWDVNNAFHYPWCLYLSTLTCWAFHFANMVNTNALTSPINNTAGNAGGANVTTHEPCSSSHGIYIENGTGTVDDGIAWHAKAEMNALVSNMTSAVVPENLWRVLGKFSTSGLTTVMVKHLSNIRWAVVHEGMKVLRGLVPERPIKEYEAFLK